MNLWFCRAYSIDLLEKQSIKITDRLSMYLETYKVFLWKTLLVTCYNCPPSVADLGLTKGGYRGSGGSYPRGRQGSGPSPHPENCWFQGSLHSFLLTFFQILHSVNRFNLMHIIGILNITCIHFLQMLVKRLQLIRLKYIYKYHLGS